MSTQQNRANIAFNFDREWEGESRLAACGELRLLQAMLFRAIADLYGSDGQDVRREALAWFRATEREEGIVRYGTFNYCCAELNLDRFRVCEALERRGFFDGNVVFRRKSKMRTGPNKKVRSRSA